MVGRRCRAAVALGIGVALGLLPGLARAALDAPVAPTEEARILFVSARASGEIYSVEADGSGETRITAHDPSALAPAWSPDGSRLVFDGASATGIVRLWRVNADGSGVRRLGFPDTPDYPLRDADWSSGVRPLVLSWREAIVVARADGTDPRRLTRRWDDAFDPAWSPSGRRILFNRADLIYVMSRDGTRRRLVGPGFGADWSPDGRRIVFADFTHSRSFDLFTAKPDGTDRRRLFSSKRPESRPAWRPRGASIAFERRRAVWTVRPDGTHARRLARNAATPAWHPTRPVLAVARAGRPDPLADGDDSPATALVVLRADGTFVRRLTTPAFDRDVAASPDGAKIAFTSYRPFGQSGVYVADADGGNELFVHAGRSPAWSPDGSRLVLEDEGGLLVVDPDGSNPAPVPLPAGLDPGVEPDPSWHPDGVRVSLVAQQSGSCPAVWALEPDGSNPARMTPASCSIRLHSFDWTPGGTSVVFSGQDDCDECAGRLYRVDGPEAVPVALTDAAQADDREPAVSPDGATVAFTRIDFSSYPTEDDIWLVNVDGTGAKRLTRRGWESAPAWLAQP